jgi:hypothetical protein
MIVFGVACAALVTVGLQKSSPSHQSHDKGQMDLFGKDSSQHVKR